MKFLTYFLLLATAFLSCQKNEVISEFTGNEAKYALAQVGSYPISGVVTLKERKDGTTTVVVELSGTQGNSKFPVHVHLGDLSTPDATVAALLNPIDGSTGKSETLLTTFADETAVSYKSLLVLNACMKIHLSDTGAESKIILAAGNIGKSSTLSNGTNSRIGISLCKSE